MISLAIADDQALVRAGFRTVLAGEDDLTVVAEAADGAEAIRVARRARPDVFLMDIRMPGVDGVAATREICAHTGVRVIILTTYESDDYVYGAIQAGASGFLLKDIEPEELIHAVRVVAGGDALLAPR